MRNVVRVLVVTLLILSGCNINSPEIRSQGLSVPVGAVQQVEMNYSFEIDANGKLTAFPPTRIPAGTFSTPTGEPNSLHPAPRRIHPILAEKLARLPENGDTVEQLIVSYEDTLEVPRFETIDGDELLDSPIGLEKLAINRQLIEQIKLERAPQYRAKTQLLNEVYGARVVGQFWLINGLIIDVPLNAVEGLLADADVTYLEPVVDGSPPPQARDVAGGRQRINSDWYYNQVSGGLISLLDTGVRRTHTLFNDGSGSRIRTVYNCSTGPSYTCSSTPDPSFDDPCMNGHGTATSGILSANGDQGNAFRGVTRRQLDVYRVYTNQASCGLITTAAVEAFQRAVEVGPKIIVAEMQGLGDYNSSIPVAAENAFNTGKVVIAANGNAGPNASTMRAPANAHKVIGVGSYDVIDLTTPASQSRGPTSDDRIKPDIQAPTCTETASSASDTSRRTCFSGTSGATPYAAGAAALVLSYLQIGNNIDWAPGQIYSYLISSGSDPYPFGNTAGAGQLRLHGSATFNNLGATDISQGETVNISISLNSAIDYDRIRAAIWWGEGRGATSHNNINLYLVDPGGTVRASSTDDGSVFELTQFANPVSGTWRLRIVGANVPTGSQRVYYTGGTNF